MQIVEVEPAAKGSRLARFAAPLSFLLPGLGQAAVGRRRRGALLAIPALAVAAALVGLVVVIAGDSSTVLDLLPGPEGIAALLVLQGALFVHHAGAILDAERLGRAVRAVRGSSRVVSALVLVALLAGTVAIHGAVGTVEAEAGGALASVFGPGGEGVDDDDAWAIPEPSFEPEPTRGPAHRRPSRPRAARPVRRPRARPPRRPPRRRPLPRHRSRPDGPSRPPPPCPAPTGPATTGSTSC